MTQDHTLPPLTISKTLASNALLKGCYCSPLMMTMNTSLTQSMQGNLSYYAFSEQVDVPFKYFKKI